MNNSYLELEKISKYSLKEINEGKNDIRKYLENFNLIDNKSPIGANDTARIYAYIKNGKIHYSDYNIKARLYRDS